MELRNREGYKDPTATLAVANVSRPPRQIVKAKRDIRLVCETHKVKISGRLVLIDEKGRRW